MRKNIFLYGAIAGVITTAWMIVYMLSGAKPDSEYGELFGYATMLLAFSMIVVGVKNFRDKQNDGVISFGKAFRVGLGIAFVASTIYVVVWLTYYYASGTNFIEEYSQCMINRLKESGASPVVVAQKTKEMNEFAVLYQNPFFNALVTYSEIFPVGLLVSLIAALFLKRKKKPEPAH